MNKMIEWIFSVGSNSPQETILLILVIILAAALLLPILKRNAKITRITVWPFTFEGVKEKEKNHSKFIDGVKIIIKHLRKDNFQPDVILSFTRSGSVLAGILAVNLGADQVISVSRSPKRSCDKVGGSRVDFVLDELADIKWELLKDKKILVVFFGGNLNIPDDPGQ